MIEKQLYKIFENENPGQLPDEIEERVRTAMEYYPYIKAALVLKVLENE